MSTIRIANRTKFVQVSNDTARDARLSFKARGMLTWLLSHSDGWTSNAADVERAGTEGREAIRKGLHELEAAGYLVRRRFRDPETQRWGMEWTVYERPELAAADGEPHTASRTRLPAHGSPPTATGPVNKNTNEQNTNTEDGAASGVESQPLELELVEPPVGASFDEFWKAYPGRGGKKAGKAQSMDLWRKLTPGEQQQALAGVGPYAAWCTSTDRFPKDPERFIKRRLWEDFADGEPVAPSADAAWGEVRAAIARNGRANPPVEWSHPAVAAAVRQMGWGVLCAATHGADAAFGRAYTAALGGAPATCPAAAPGPVPVEQDTRPERVPLHEARNQLASVRRNLRR